MFKILQILSPDLKLDKKSCILNQWDVSNFSLLYAHKPAFALFMLHANAVLTITEHCDLSTPLCFALGISSS